MAQTAQQLALTTTIQALLTRLEEKPLKFHLFADPERDAAEKSLQDSFIALLKLMLPCCNALATDTTEEVARQSSTGLFDKIQKWLRGEALTVPSQPVAVSRMLFLSPIAQQASPEFLAKFRHKIWRLLEAVLLFDQTLPHTQAAAPAFVRLRDHVSRLLAQSEHGGNSISFEKGLALLALGQRLSAAQAAAPVDAASPDHWSLHNILTEWWNGALPVQTTRVQAYTSCASMFYVTSRDTLEFICFLRSRFSTL